MDDFYRALGRASREQALAKLNVLSKKVENALHDRENVSPCFRSLSSPSKRRTQFFDLILVMQCEFQRLGLIAQGFDSGAAIVDLFRQEDSRDVLIKELFSKL